MVLSQHNFSPIACVETQIIFQMAVPIRLDMAPRVDMKLVRAASLIERGVHVGGWAGQAIVIANINIDARPVSSQRLSIGVDAVERADRRAIRPDRAEAIGVAR